MNHAPHYILVITCYLESYGELLLKLARVKSLFSGSFLGECTSDKTAYRGSDLLKNKYMNISLTAINISLIGILRSTEDFDTVLTMSEVMTFVFLFKVQHVTISSTW